MMRADTIHLDEGHLDHCTSELQANIVALRLKGLTWGEIEAKTGTTATNACKYAKNVIRRAAHNGYDPLHNLDTGLPPGQRLAGVTNLYGFKDGKRELRSQYVLGRKDKDLADDSLREAIEAAIAGLKPRKAIKAPKRCDSDLLTMYHFTDYHLAMYAYAAETGGDWNTELAQANLRTGIQELMDGSPDSEVGVFSQGGDFCHYDGLLPLTPASKHVLDSDSRISVMVELALDMHVHAIEQLLTKHKRVVAVIQEGNHDEASSVWLRKTMVRYFAKNKRVEIMDNDFPYYGLTWGDFFIGWHHGHKKAIKSLPSYFAAEPRFRRAWGEAVYAYIHTGHYHKKEQAMDEYGGAVVERHPTLAAPDSYAARGGFHSQRGVNAITYHQKDGEVSRRTAVPRHV